MLQNPIIQKRFANNLNSIASVVPTFSDAYLSKLLGRIHMEQGSEELQQEFLTYLLLNPFNAYKFIDTLFFLLLANVQQRQGMDNPLFDLEIVPKLFLKDEKKKNQKKKKMNSGNQEVQNQLLLNYWTAVAASLSCNSNSSSSSSSSSSSYNFVGGDSQKNF